MQTIEAKRKYCRTYYARNKHLYIPLRIARDDKALIETYARADSMSVNEKINEYITWGLEAERRAHP